MRRPGLRAARPNGFFKCGRRSNCALCRHSVNTSSYTCPITGESVTLTQHISCQNTGIYLILCKKTTGLCSRLAPTYIGITGEGEASSFTHRLSGHLGTATQKCHEDTLKTIGRHFRLAGHCVETDLRMLPIEIVSSPNPFLLRARESFYIEKFQTEKRFSVNELEHGLNLDRGQR